MAAMCSLLGVLALAALWQGGTADERPRATPSSAERVVHVRVEGPLQAGTQSLIARALREAREGDTFVLELDTPGGSLERMFQIALAIDAAGEDGVRTVAWINRWASSAGSYVAMSCDRLYMVEHGTIGSATPIVASPLGGAVEIPEGDLREKQYSQNRSDFRAWAEAHGYNGALAESMVDRDVVVYEALVYDVDEDELDAPVGEAERTRSETRILTDTELANLDARGVPVTRTATIVGAGELCNLTGREAFDLGLAHGLRDSFDELIGKLGLTGAEVVTIEPARSEELANVLDSVRWYLLIIALVAAYAEFKAPGFGLFGILSIVCFAALLFGRYLVGLADVLHLVAVGLGIVLIAVELFLMPGQIWVGLLGAVLVIGGLVSANVGPAEGLRYGIGRQIALDTTMAFVRGAFLALVAIWLLARFLPKTPVGSRMILQPDGAAFAAATAGPSGGVQPVARVGCTGRALTDLRPVGKVRIEGDETTEHEARSAGTAIERGTPVRVVDVGVGRVVVEPLSDGENAGSSGADGPGGTA